MIGPIRIKPIIKRDNENNFEIKIILLFSLPNIFDMYNIVIVSGTTAILIIEIASTAWINFGKNTRMIFGKTVTPSIEIPIEIKIKIFFKFLFESPLESCGNKYLKEIEEKIIRIEKICNDKE